MVAVLMYVMILVPQSLLPTLKHMADCLTHLDERDRQNML